jgi:hypothetical protein
MLGAHPLNSQPINGLAGGGSYQIGQGGSFTWALQVLLDGIDVTAALTGSVTISRSEDGDAVAQLAIFLGAGAVDVAGYTGAALSIDFIVRGEPDFSSRRFTGYLVQPSFDVLSRVLLCEATTRLSDAIERMEFDEIDLLTGGLWSVDVFEDTAGRSRWDYAQERMSTRPASLNVDRFGLPRVTSWHPPVVVEFGEGATVYESLDVNLAPLSDMPNVYALELDYRYTRFREFRQSYEWTHPLGSFEAWRADSSELPDVPMLAEAVDSAGWFITGAPTYVRLPGDRPDLPQPWYNKNTDLLLSAHFTAGIRWSQRGVEQYRIRLQVDDSVAAVDEVIERARVVLDTDTESDRLWEQGASLEELPERDQQRLEDAVLCALQVGRTALLKGHRSNQVTWQTPLAHALGVDFGQGCRVRDGLTLVTGAPVELEEEIDIESGLAMLTITLAVSRGKNGAQSDDLVVPSAPEFDDGYGPVMSGVLPTQLGLRASSPLYDEDLPGFAGNYSIGNGDPSLRFPRRFMLKTPEISEEWRNEVQAESLAMYSVAPPVDTLEL